MLLEVVWQGRQAGRLSHPDPKKRPSALFVSRGQMASQLTISDPCAVPLLHTTAAGFFFALPVPHSQVRLYTGRLLLDSIQKS